MSLTTALSLLFVTCLLSGVGPIEFGLCVLIIGFSGGNKVFRAAILGDPRYFRFGLMVTGLMLFILGGQLFLEAAHVTDNVSLRPSDYNDPAACIMLITFGLYMSAFGLGAFTLAPHLTREWAVH